MRSLIDNVQATTGTDWTLIGSYDDITVPAGVAVPGAYVAVGHKAIYRAHQITPRAYTH
jgi:hypothetical protein